MASYSLKELKGMTTEKLICQLVLSSGSQTKLARQTEDKVFKILSENGVIDYEKMKSEYEMIGMW